MHATARLSNYAEATINDLQADGITLTPVEIVTINALCWEVESPESRRMLSRGIPVEVGGATLWPMTLLAGDWNNRVGLSMRPKWMTTLALGYAMAHGYSDGPELDREGIKAAVAVGVWYVRLRCRTSTFILAIADILEQEAEHEQPPSPDEDTLEVGEFSASLAVATGISAEFWERRCSQGYAFASLNAIAKQNHADDKPMDSDPKLRAERALGWYELKIRRRHETT